MRSSLRSRFFPAFRPSKWLERRLSRGLQAAALALSALFARGAASEGKGGPIVAPPEVRFAAGEARARPGETVSLPVALFTDHPLLAVRMALDFDETLVEATEVVRVSAADPSPAGEALSATIRNVDEVPGVQSARAGWVAIELTSETAVAALDLPQGVQSPVFEIRFTVLPVSPDRAPEGSLFTPVVFADIAVAVNGGDQVFTNAVTVSLETGPEDITLAAAALEKGGLDIDGIGEIGFFVRGDANLDRELNLTDPIFTLRSLFVAGAPKPVCPDAADADDSGALNLTDGVYLCRALFTGGPPPPAPFPSCGQEPTPDDLKCEQGYPDCP